LNAELSRKRLRAPVNVTWEMTMRCNLSCIHCLSGAGEASVNEMDYGECIRLIDQLSAMKVFQVNIGGGEPFMRDDFIDLLRYAHAKGIVTCVSTNGMLIDERLARKLSALKMLYLQISMDGATPEVNDSIRGKGTYTKILKSMDMLSHQDVPFSINLVLTRLNYPQLELMRAMAKRYGTELRVSRFRPSGRGKDSKAYLGPGIDQLEAFAAWLERHDMVRTGDSFFCLTSEKRRRQGLDMCGAAKMTCCIAASGDVYPCAFLQEKPFWVGNLRDNDLKYLWDKSPVLDQLRDLNVKACERCVRFDVCRGGCPAMAFHTYRDISMPDPECLVNLKMSSGGLPEVKPYHV
jgi:mycofactocin biosynthetic radical S-adenosylmethionine protein MftC